MFALIIGKIHREHNYPRLVLTCFNPGIGSGVLMGENNDWVKCLPGCKKHFYSTEAKKALFEMNLINHPDELKDARPENHRLCRILVEKHAGQRCSIISSVSTSNMAQHIVRKFKDAPGLVTLFRYVHLHHITSHHITLLYITLHYITLHYTNINIHPVKLHGYN